MYLYVLTIKARKLSLIIVILTFLMLSCSESTTSQTIKTKNVLSHNLKGNVENDKMIKSSKTEFVNQSILNNKGQVKEVFKKFIDELYLKKNSIRAFELYTAFDMWDKIDEEANNEKLFAHRLLKNIPDGLGSLTNARIAAAIWEYERQSLYLTLGTHSIVNSDESLPFASDYNDLRSQVLKKNKSKFPDFDFEGLNEQEIEKDLNNIEKNFDDIKKLISAKIDNAVYQQNIENIKKSIKISKTSVKGRIYYVVAVPTLNLGFLITQKQNKLKIIGLYDNM